MSILSTFLSDLAAADTSEALSAALARAGQNFGLPHFAYLGYPPGNNLRNEPIYVSNYDPSWVTTYISRRYDRVDPVIRDGAGGIMPFTWGTSNFRKGLRGVARDLFDEADSFGVSYGFTVPVHDNRGRPAMLTLATNETERSFERLIARHRDLLHIACLHFHAHARRKLLEPVALNGVKLSEREVECLEWIARGKSIAEAADAMGLSRATAVYHVENAKRKLDAVNLVQCVARAMMLGLLNP